MPDTTDMAALRERLAVEANRVRDQRYVDEHCCIVSKRDLLTTVEMFNRLERTEAREKELERELKLNGNRWPDPLEHPAVKALKDGDIFNPEVLAAMDALAREIQIHRNYRRFDYKEENISPNNGNLLASEGWERAAKWVDARREAYDKEHSKYDNETGMTEFSNAASEEYSTELFDIAEGLRAEIKPAGESA